MTSPHNPTGSPCSRVLSRRHGPCANCPCSTHFRFQCGAICRGGSHQGSDRGILSGERSSSCNTGSICEGAPRPTTSDCANPGSSGSTSTSSDGTLSSCGTTTFSNCKSDASGPTSTNSRICTIYTSSGNGSDKPAATNDVRRVRCDGNGGIATGGGTPALTSADSSSNGTSSPCCALVVEEKD